MTTWKGGGDYGRLCLGRLCREVVDEDGHAVCRVWIRQINKEKRYLTEPWPEGEAHFRLILAAPKMLEALEEIAALETPRWPSLAEVADIYEQSMKIARAAIAAAKGENDEKA